MGITTVQMINRKTKDKNFSLTSGKLVMLFAMGVCNLNVFAQGDLNVTADISSAYTHQDVESDNADRADDISTLSIIPRLSAEYRSRTFQGRWAGTYTYLDREIDESSRSDNFSEYLYAANWAPLDNLLVVSATGGLSYQNVNVNGVFVNDFLLNSEDLAKTRSNRVAIESTIASGDYITGTGIVSYSATDAERRAQGDNANLDNDTISASGTLQNGSNIRSVFWRLSGSYQETERSARRDDFFTRLGSLNIDVPVYRNLAFAVTGYHEANQFSDINQLAAQSREFNSIGAGISYRAGLDRRIAITANRTESDFEETDDDSFIGVELVWAFSPRTRISANYGKRFYGDAGNLNFTYNSKRIRTRISYNEDVTSFSRLIADPENLGVFVCADGITELSACFQPDSLNYDLEPNEQFVEFSSQNLEVDDDVLLRKALNAQLGYEGRSLSVGIDGRYSFDEYLEQQRENRVYSIGLTAGLTLGRYTDLNARIAFANTEQRSTTLGDGFNDTWNASLSLRREIGRQLSIEARANYIDRSGTLDRGSQGAEVTDRRISINVTYRFSDR